MFQWLENKLGAPKETVGVFVRLLSDNEVEISAIHLQLIKGVVEIASEVHALKSYQELAQWLPKTAPVSITFDGKGILHKKVEGIPISEQAKLLTQAIPNARPTDFYLQTVNGHQGIWVSIVRVQILDGILGELSAVQIIPSKVSIGVFPLADLIEKSEKNAEITNGIIAGYELQFSNGKINQMRLSVDPGNLSADPLGILELTQNQALPYAAAFQLLLPAPIELQIPSVSAQWEDYKQKQVFQVLGWGALIFFLIILMGNYAFFELFSSKNRELQTKQSLFTGKLERMNELQRSIKEREAFLDKTGWKNSPHLSFYADRIGASIPREIRLSKLEVFPVRQKSKGEHKIVEIENKTILVTGLCTRPTVLNEWVVHMKMLKWVNEVTLEDYHFDALEKEGVFTVRVKAGTELE